MQQQDKGIIKLKFAKYDKDNFQLKISKQEAKEIIDILDAQKRNNADMDYYFAKAYIEFYYGLKNLTSSNV